MTEKKLTTNERSNLIQLCSLISGYHVSCYEKMDDKNLTQEYDSLSKRKEKGKLI